MNTATTPLSRIVYRVRVDSFWIGDANSRDEALSFGGEVDICRVSPRLNRCCIVHPSGLLGRVEQPEISILSSNEDTGSPLGEVRIDPFVSTRALANRGIRGLLTASCPSEIASAIVQTIAVAVVHSQRNVGRLPHKHPVHLDNLLTRRPLDCRTSVTRTVNMPIVPEHNLGVFRVNKSKLARRYGHHNNAVISHYSSARSSATGPRTELSVSSGRPIRRFGKDFSAGLTSTIYAHFDLLRRVPRRGGDSHARHPSAYDNSTNKPITTPFFERVMA